MKEKNPIPTSDEIKANQATIWSSADPTWTEWDQVLERGPRPINEWLCAAAGLTPGMEVLDLASGVGQPAVTVAERVGPSGRVMATDIAPGMIEELQRCIQTAGLTNLEARLMDMESLDFPDETFDAIAARWAYMFAPNAVGAISESRRVLKAGGRIATATWDVADKNWWQGAQIFEKVLNPILPPPPPDPNAPNPLRFSDPNLLEDMFKEAGMSGISIERVPFTFEFSSGEEWWGFISSVNAPAAARLRRLDEAQLVQVREQSILEIEKFSSGGKLSLGAVCLCTAAQK